jgi:hypothetical protein
VQSFEAFGITWEWYSGTSACNLGSIGRVVPEGVRGLFITRNAPANTSAAVGTLGRPYYVTSEPMDHDQGIELKGQANPLSICTRPAAVIDVTISG